MRIGQRLASLWLGLSKSLVGSTTSAAIALFVIALLPRVFSLGTFITWDEPMWVYRSIHFLTALLQGDLRGTFLVGHPGVITMISGSLGIAVQRFVLGQGAAELSWLRALPALEPTDVEAMRRLALFLPAAKLPLAVLHAFCVLAIFLLAKRLLDSGVAFLAALFVALDPFHIALSRVLHIDAAAANFMLLSLLALIIYLRKRRSPYLLISGAFCGLAALSKSYALFLVPFTALVLVVDGAASRSRAQDVAFHLGCWGCGAIVAFSALWPSMWVDPVGTVRGVLETAVGYSASAEASSRFFLGSVEGDPDLLFYPVVLAFRTTPLVWLGLLGLVGSAIAAQRRTHRAWHAVRQHDLNTRIMVAYVCLFVLAMAFAAKKFDRYMLPAIVALDLVAAVGLALLMRALRFPGAGLVLGAALAIQGAFVLSYSPYYIAYYNPLAGGTRLAPSAVPLGWGEGMDLAAHYLNQKENAEELTVAAGGIPGFAAYFSGQVNAFSERGLATSDYVILYISDMQQGSLLVEQLAEQEPEHVLRVRGMDYVWVYANAAYQEVASHLRDRLGPDEAILIDAPSPLLRDYPEAYVIAEAPNEDEVTSVLRDIAASHKRLWYVAYPDSDPEGWIDFQLHAHALLLNRSHFSRVTASLYSLPAPAAFAGMSVGGDLKADFGGQLWLIGYRIAEGTIEYRKELGVELRWQTPQETALDYAASLRLVDGQGHDWAVTDRWLLDSSGASTSAWLAGEISEERYLLSIPPAIPPGQYNLNAVVYEVETLQSVPVLDAAGMPIGTDCTITTVNVVPPAFPPSSEELAVPHQLNLGLAGSIELLGYGLSSDQVRAGDTLELSLYCKALSSIQQDFTLLLQLQDKQGDTWMEASCPLPNASYPTSQWRPGETLHVRCDLLVDAAVPTGSYLLLADLRGTDGIRLGDVGVPIAELWIESRERSFSAPQIRFPAQATLAGAASLVGYDLNRTAVEPGGSFRLTLYWQPLASMEQSLTVFTHLLDAANRIWGQQDCVPCRGACPTTDWLEGEFITDEYEINVAPDAPVGEYHIGIGMYDPLTMQRLLATDGLGVRWADDRIVLSTLITVRHGE
jgi:4-amino-4-deoxy-L-arabinose transferase-like glycosyltransferase